MGVLAALLVYALVFAWGQVYQSFELEALIGGGAVLLVTAYRLWLVAPSAASAAPSTLPRRPSPSVGNVQVVDGY
ncbi:MAG: hypothetical protein ACPH5V_08425 [Alcanivorax sp.]